MAKVRQGEICAFYLFDIAERVDLSAVPSLVGGPAIAARLAPKSPTPPYVQYEKPPLSFDGEVLGAGRIADFSVRVRLYDYGVMSLALSRPLSGTWSELGALAQDLIENAELEQRSEEYARRVATRLAPALIDYRPAFLSEDYLVFVVHALDPPLSAGALVEQYADDIAVMLRGERQPLSEHEKGNVIKHRLSYLADDLVIPTWNSALIYDTPSGATAALEIIEFANSQLLEFRYYDQLLDAQLASIYGLLQRPRRYDQWLGSRYRRAARQLHSLFIDVNELTDRTENGLKFIGDIYAVRVFALVANRLGLDTWKGNVQEKLKTLDDIYRFAVDQSAMSRGQFLELTIVLILILELVLLLLGVMH